MLQFGKLLAVLLSASVSLNLAVSLPTDFFLDVEALSIAPGVNHVCVLERQPGVEIGGRPRCWGGNDHKKCEAPKDETLVQIVSGMYYSCGITLEQSVHCWGRLPEQTVHGLYSQITGAKHYACGVLTDGKLNCWGYVNEFVRKNLPDAQFMVEHGISRFVQVSCEDTHCCALDDKGHAHCWGEERVYGSMHTPRERLVSGSEDEASPEDGSDNADFYGFNGEEELKKNSKLMEDSMVNVVFKQITVGYQFSCGIRYDNADLMCWGHLDSLKYGSSSSDFLTVKGPFKQVAGGVLGACALYEDGTIPALCMGVAKSTMTKYAVEYDQIGVSTTMICGVNMDNSQLECSGWNRNIAAGMPHGLEIA